jgi:integrase
MASSRIPFTRLRGGMLYLNLPIPSDLRPRFLTTKGKERTHIVETLGTGDHTQGRLLARERQAFWELEFSRLRRGHIAEAPSTLRQAKQLREAMAEARQHPNPYAVEQVEDVASMLADRIEDQAGTEAAQHVYTLATQPERLTLLETLGKMNEDQDVTGATKAKRSQVVRELLKFLVVEDCLPEFVTDSRAVGYVDWLNGQPLGYSTKQDRLSMLQGVWKFLARKRQVPAHASPWSNHELTKKKPATKAADQGGEEGAQVEQDKRGWTTAEAVRLFQAPETKKGRISYPRSLFRELYTLGFCTGMRLDELVSLTPTTVQEINPERTGEEGKAEAGLLVRAARSKTEAGVRSIPVLHPAAVAILRARLQRQTDPSASLFPECKPGGPDNRLSWQVQKALGRDRDALGFGREVDFHSTRRSFMTLLEQAGAQVVHAQRYVGHRVPTLMHSVYSDGASLDNLRKVAELVRYPEDLEAEFRKAAGLKA